MNAPNDYIPEDVRKTLEAFVEPELMTVMNFLQTYLFLKENAHLYVPSQ